MARFVLKRINRIISESIKRVIAENNIHDLDRQMQDLKNQLNGLDVQHKKIQAQINKLKSIAKMVPEEAGNLTDEINELIQQLNDIKNQKIPVREKIKELEKQYAYMWSSKRLQKKGEIDTDPSEQPVPKAAPNKDIAIKRKKSHDEVKQMGYDKKMEDVYNTIMKDGYLLISKGAKVLVTSDGKKRIQDINYIVRYLENYLKKTHPDQKVKKTFIPRKRREWRQLDDIEYYDLKVTIVNDNTIKFSPDDVFYDTSSY